MIRFWTGAACREARSRMLEGIEGSLELRARLDVEEHLGRCARCAEELADLAATHNALRRAFEPYRRARARVAPARARVRAGTERSAESTGPRALRLFGRPAEPALVFAMLALAFVGTLPGGGERATVRGPITATAYVRAADDHGGLLRPNGLRGDRIPVADGVVIELTRPSETRGATERVREGLRPSTPN